LGKLTGGGLGKPLGRVMGGKVHFYFKFIDVFRLKLADPKSPLLPAVKEHRINPA